jgi:Xaa-Pro dipeptidase
MKPEAMINPSHQELIDRIAGLFSRLNQISANFDTAIIMSKLNQYYYTGTMQDGLLILRRDGTVAYFIRKSFERARLESPLDCLYRINTYRDMLEVLPANLGQTFVEIEVMPLATIDRLKKYFTLGALLPLDRIIASQRSVKSPYELAWIAESGRQHEELMESIVPMLLRAGMSETDLLAEIYSAMVKLGHHGVSRFSMFQTEMIVGQVGFGPSSLYPTNFDGPGGMRGLCPAVPLIGDRQRFLQRGDIVFVDVGYGVHGYHSDKTQVYSFGKEPDPAVAAVHQACRQVLHRASGMLTVGRRPAEIYKSIMADLPPELNEHFMGYGEDSVKFLGHGVGLHIDEIPVIANSSQEPLQANMVIALEPKCGITGVGTVGVEETFVVTADGPVCLTGGDREIVVVPAP